MIEFLCAEQVSLMYMSVHVFPLSNIKHEEDQTKENEDDNKCVQNSCWKTCRDKTACERLGYTVGEIILKK